MNRTITMKSGLLLAAALVTGLVAAFYAVSGAHAGGSRVVMSANNKALHSTILVNRSGMTLYSLSTERRGRFICKDGACLAEWHPLVVAKGVKPSGATHLSTVKRPDGRVQVAFKGLPLYTFDEDHKRGDVKGNGFKDVGTWRVAIVGKSHSSSSPAPKPRYSSHY
jgi:predicted lipoprotein with Yx(FWY)xxD motif